jgi:hypothetical protein
MTRRATTGEPQPVPHDVYRAAALLRIHGFTVVAPAPSSPPMAGRPPKWGTCISPSVELETLARLAGALRLCWSDPWRFYETRSDLVARLRRLACWAREREERAEDRVR